MINSLKFPEISYAVKSSVTNVGALSDPIGSHGAAHFIEHLLTAPLTKSNQPLTCEVFGYVTPFLTVVGYGATKLNNQMSDRIEELPTSFMGRNQYLSLCSDHLFDDERRLMLGEVSDISSPFTRHLNYALGFPTPRAVRFGAAGDPDFISRVTKKELAACAIQASSMDMRAFMSLVSMSNDDWLLVRDKHASECLIDITNTGAGEGSTIAFVIPKEFMYVPDPSGKVVPGLFALKYAYAVGGGDHSLWFHTVRALGGYHAGMEFHVTPFGALVLLVADVPVSYATLSTAFNTTLCQFSYKEVSAIPTFMVRDQLYRLIEVTSLVDHREPLFSPDIKRDVVPSILSKGVMMSVKRERKFKHK